jgi:DNA-binding MarR family transcriptional regulator
MGMKDSSSLASRPRRTSVVRKEAPQATTFPDVAEADGLLMSVVRNLLYVEDRTSDLPLRQLHVCVTLYGGPLSMSQLSRKLGVSMSAMTQIADRLERAGMVARQASDPDRRVRCLILTLRGRRALQAHEKVRQERLAAAFQTLDAASRRKLIAGLKLFQAACTTIAR